MSVLSTIKEYFGFGTEEPQSPRFTVPPTLDERLAEAAADRGYAMGLVEDAAEALRDSAQVEAEVAAEALRRSERSMTFAREQAERIIATGEANAARYDGLAATAQTNAVDDSSAAFNLANLLRQERDDAAL